MLSADAEQLLMTDANTLEAEVRHTAVIIHTDSAKHEFKTSIGKRDEFTQEFPQSQGCRVREKKINGLRPTWDYPHLDHSPLKKFFLVHQPPR